LLGRKEIAGGIKVGIANRATDLILISS
jgi:hypothetical protein